MDSIVEYNIRWMEQPIGRRNYITISRICQPEKMQKVILNRFNPQAEEIDAKEQGGCSTKRNAQIDVAAIYRKHFSSEVGDPVSKSFDNIIAVLPEKQKFTPAGLSNTMAVMNDIYFLWM